MKEAKLPAGAVALHVSVAGRVQGWLQRGEAAFGQASVRYQWPGLYFTTSFQGRSVFFKTGPGERQDLRVVIDGVSSQPFVSRSQAVYRVSALKRGTHEVRLEVISENQAGPVSFLGFFATGSAQQGDRTQTRRQIEFIGDSYTVGYGNTSPTRSCTPEQVWLTTDNSKAFGPLTANAYGADYQVNAISGRGVVRNYNGGTKDTLVQMYPFVLFDKKERYSDPSWRPQVVVVGLGTNDFSTELHPGEQWSSREQLHAEYEATYVRFLQQLRQQQPQAYLLLWATDGEHGELQAEEARVVEQLRASGDRRIGLVMTSGLQMSGCDGHPSAADDKEISARLREAIDGVPDIWNGTGK